MKNQRGTRNSVLEQNEGNISLRGGRGKPPRWIDGSLQLSTRGGKAPIIGGKRKKERRGMAIIRIPQEERVFLNREGVPSMQETGILQRKGAPLGGEEAENTYQKKDRERNGRSSA